jgi:hypothetical protein
MRIEPLCLALAAAGLAAVAPVGTARAANVATLPSPLAALTQSPPLGGGASSSAENARHSVSAHTVVQISVDTTGAPFAVTATQRLDVGVLGDFFFTIGAPLVDVEATSGSEEVPGLRTGAIVWAGFNPSRRVLAARATLDPARVVPSLPLRIERTANAVTLVNATQTSTTAYSADAVRKPLLAYLSTVRAAVGHGLAPPAGTALLTSRPVPVRVEVTAPLRVVGKVAGRHVSTILRDKLVVPASGPVDLRVTPVASVEVPDAAQLGGRTLLRAVVRSTLTLARTRQYDSFLGNPDPVGRSETTYLYRTATKIAPARPAAVATSHRDWERPVLLLAVIALAGVAGLAAWARS